jgi:branched-chain amino acid transport system ATP-binding protein
LATDALEVDGLHAWYGDCHVLYDVSFRLGPGRLLALLGRNGTGKTTCIGALIGLVRSEARELSLFGQRIAGLSPEAISFRGVGLVPQGRRIFSSLTVRENLTVAARGRGWTLENVYGRFPGLGQRDRQIAGSLSGGEQQMLAIGRALMTNPRLLLLDEPSEGLAPQVVGEVSRALQELKRSGLSIVLVEQNTRLALEIADEAVILNSGRVGFMGTVEDVRSNPRLLEHLLGVD